MTDSTPRAAARRPLVDRATAWASTHRYVVDALIATPVAALGLLFDQGMFGALGLVGLTTTLPLYLRRTHTDLATALCAVACFGVLALTTVHPEGFLSPVFAVPLVLFAVAAYGSERAARFALVAGVAGGATATFVQTHANAQSVYQVVAVMFLVAAFLAGIWGFGRVRRLRTREVTRLRDHNRLLEQDRERENELVALAERTRIAREMHDIVAHSLSAVIAQADGGRYVAASDPEAAARALETIAETGRGALADMRGLLSVLRSDDPRAVNATPGIADVPDLVAGAALSGTRVTYTENGDPQPVSAGVGLTVYRVVQESLTNVRKHAGPAASATVDLEWGPGTVTVTVTDDGRGAAASPLPSGRQGLVGMRERVALHDGSVRAGALVGGGFRVRAVVPAGDGGPASDDRAR